MKNIMVSVSMITYGHEKFIRQAIEGVLMQDCSFNVELILANDCSPDHTDSIVKEIITTHKNPSILINYINHEKNIGMIPNFIYTLQQSQGKYIAICEGDDYWTDPFKLQKQVAILEKHSNVSLVYSNAKIISDDKGDYINDEFFYDKNYPPTLIKSQAFFLKNNFALLSVSILFRKEYIRGNELELMKKFAVGDMPLYFILSGKGNFYYINEPMVVYNDHRLGISKTFGKLKRNLTNYKQMSLLLPYIQTINIADFNYFCQRFLIIPIFNAMFGKAKVGELKDVKFSQIFFVKWKHLKPKYFYYYLKLIYLR